MSKIDKVYKLLSTLFCVLGLIFTSSEVIYEYWQGKTIANINVQRKTNLTLPAITICYPNLISFEKISKLDNNYNKLYEEYLAQVNLSKSKVFRINDSNRTKPERKIYHQIRHDVFSRVNNGNLDLNKIVQNYTVDLKNSRGERMIKILIDQTQHEFEESPEKVNKYQDDFIGYPMETIEIAKNIKGHWITCKCFTFFTSLDKKWRQFKMYWKHMSIRIKQDSNAIPLNGQDTIYFAIHSPNTLPDISDGQFKFLTMKNSIIITYSQMTTLLLGQNYLPKCHKYDPTHITSNMRSQCIAWCYQKRINEICKSDAFVPSHFLYRKENFIQVQNRKIEHCFLRDKERKSRVKVSCSHQCEKDCEFYYYAIEDRWSFELNDTGQLQLEIEHNNLPDISIKYLPKITFLHMVCSFGGLLGMWLGVSILVIFEDMSKIFRVLSNKLKHRPVINMINLNRPTIMIEHSSRITSWSSVFLQTQDIPIRIVKQ